MKKLLLLFYVSVLLVVFTGCRHTSPQEQPVAVDSATAVEAQDSVPDPRPGDFVVVTDLVPDAILEIRYYSTYNFIGDRIPGYEEPIAILTRAAAEALKEASDQFEELGYRIKIYDAYRPQCAVDYFVKWAKDLNDVRMKDYFYPELEKSVLFPQGFIATKSGHTRGSTVDLTLFDKNTGKEVDMGCTFDYFGKASYPMLQPGEAAGAYQPINRTQYENRMTLRKVMLAHGFKPYANEWWHFTLKNEPYPDTYFNFPVSREGVESGNDF